MPTPSQVGLSGRRNTLGQGVVWKASFAQDLSFQAGQGAASFARAAGTGTNGYYLGADGLLHAVGANVARFDWTGGIPGVLIEPAATNLLLHSNADNAVWTKTNGAVTTDSSADPTGSTAATNIFTASGANGTFTQNLGTLASAARVFGIWLKRLTGTGVVNLSIDGTIFVPVTVTAGWKLFQLPATTTATNPGIQLVTSGDAVYWWNGQCETGNVSTSPITTVAATAARALDNLGIPVAGNVCIPRGTFAATHYYLAPVDSVNLRTLVDFGGIGNNGLCCFINDASSSVAEWGTGSGTKAVAGAAAVTFGWQRIAFTWDIQNGVSIFVNGQFRQGANFSMSLTLYTSPANFYIGCRNGSSLFANAIIRDAILYGRALSMGEIQADYRTNRKGW